IQSRIGFIKCGARDGKFPGDLSAHARVLRALPWKHKGDFHKEKTPGHKDTKAQRKAAIKGCLTRLSFVPSCLCVLVFFIQLLVLGNASSPGNPKFIEF